LRLFYAEAVALGEICLVATSDGLVAGFVAGSAQPGGFFKKLIRRRALAFGLAALPAVLRRPSTAARVARALVKPKQAAKAAGIATLMSIGVDPATQGTGAGKALMLAFLDEARRRGATTVDLTTDKLENDRTNAFYLSLGFAVAREITTPEGRVLNEYEIDVRGR
jgi:ribosomal protein S18 acetylase RimI-like enzyme